MRSKLFRSTLHQVNRTNQQMRLSQPLIVEAGSQILGQNCGCIVAAWQHESVEQVLDSGPFSGLQLSRSAPQSSSIDGDSEEALVMVDFEFLAKSDGAIHGHDFGETGDFPFFFAVEL